MFTTIPTSMVCLERARPRSLSATPSSGTGPELISTPWTTMAVPSRSLAALPKTRGRSATSSTPLGPTTTSAAFTGRRCRGRSSCRRGRRRPAHQLCNRRVRQRLSRRVPPLPTRRRRTRLPLPARRPRPSRHQKRARSPSATAALVASTPGSSGSGTLPSAGHGQAGDREGHTLLVGAFLVALAGGVAMGGLVLARRVVR